MSGTRSACCDNSTDTVAAPSASQAVGPVGRQGFTLIELMWAMTLSLVVMGAVASLFGVFSRSLTAAQAGADMSARLRTAAWRLRQDLTGVTVDLMPPVRPESESGYFEYFEGSSRDAHAKQGFGGWALVGDVDDVLMFTTRSEGQPFVGRYGDGTIESPVAEVAWFCMPSSVQPLADMDTTLFTLYRRQKIVMPYVGRDPFVGTNTSSAAAFAPNLHDLSVRLVGGTTFIPNSLGDLTKRENRFLRGDVNPPPFFPYVWATGTTMRSGTLFPPPDNATQPGNPLTRTMQLVGPSAMLATSRVGDDVILSNILSFDVRVFDPQARRGTGPAVKVVASAGQSTVTCVLNNAGMLDEWPSPLDLNIFPSKGNWTGKPNFTPTGVLRTGSSYLLISDSGTKLGDGTITNFSGDRKQTFTLSAPATASGTMWLTTGTLEPGDAYWGGPAFFAAPGPAVGGYVDLAWGGEVKMPLNACKGEPDRNGGTGDREGEADLNVWWSNNSTYQQRVNALLMPDFYPPAAQAVGTPFPPPGRTAFQTGGVRVSGMAVTGLESGSFRTYDTWSTHYESNGIDDDKDGIVDEGTNGVDDNNDGVPDDPAEAETSAPYPARLQGLEIRIRCYEPASGQIRQITLRHTFLAK